MISVLSHLLRSNGNNDMPMKKQLILRILACCAMILLCSLELLAQLPEKKQVNDQLFYVHTVKTGETLFTIAQLYEIQQTVLLSANPGSEKGVDIGKELLIPVQFVTIEHTVQAKETLYGVARQYGVPPASILNANPGSENGLKTGQKIAIPNVEKKPAFVQKITSELPVSVSSQTPEDSTRNNGHEPAGFELGDSIVSHTVLASETLYSISKRYMVSVEEIQQINQLKSTKLSPGTIIKIPVKREVSSVNAIRPIPERETTRIDTTLLFPEKSTYKIALLLPFYLDKKTNATDFVSGLSTEFYMGAKLAFDSLQYAGLNADILVYDTQNDTNQVKQILTKKEFQSVDLIYGPFYPEHIPIVAQWAKKNNVRMVCPSAVNTSVLKANPMIYQAVPSDLTLMKGMADYVVRSAKTGVIILVKSAVEKDAALYEGFRSSYLESPLAASRPKLIEATLQNYASFMKKGTPITLVFPTNDKGQALKFMNSFNTIGAKYDAESIRIFGTKEWVNFDEVRSHFKNKYNFHFAGTSDLNYSDESTKDLNRLYRKTYHADLTKMAVQGYDVVRFFTSKLLLKSSNFTPIMNQFDLKQLGAGNGYENTQVYIFEQEDFQLIRKSL